MPFKRSLSPHDPPAHPYPLIKHPRLLKHLPPSQAPNLPLPSALLKPHDDTISCAGEQPSPSAKLLITSSPITPQSPSQASQPPSPPLPRLASPAVVSITPSALNAQALHVAQLGCSKWRASSKCVRAALTNPKLAPPHSSWATYVENRPCLVRWLIRACTVLKFTHKILHTAVDLLDKLCYVVVLHPDRFRLVAASVLSIAMKTQGILVEIPPMIVLSTLANTTDLERMELIALDKLEWNVNAFTVSHYLQALSNAYVTTTGNNNDNDNTLGFEDDFKYAQVAIDLTLYVPEINQKYPQNIVAIAAWAAGADYHRNTQLPDLVLNLVQEDQKELFRNCVKDLDSLLQQGWQ